MRKLLTCAALLGAVALIAVAAHAQTVSQRSNNPQTIGAVTIANSVRATFNQSLSVTVPTAAQSLTAIESDGTNVVRLRYVKVCLGVGALQTTAGARTLVLFRTTVASSGGSTTTPLLYDPVNDSAFGGIMRNGSITTTPAVGSVTIAGNALWSGTLLMPGAATSDGTCLERNWDLNSGDSKAPLAASGTVNGLALADLTGGAGGTGNYNIDLQWTIETN